MATAENVGFRTERDTSSLCTARPQRILESRDADRIYSKPFITILVTPRLLAATSHLGMPWKLAVRAIVRLQFAPTYQPVYVDTACVEGGSPSEDLEICRMGGYMYFDVIHLSKLYVTVLVTCLGDRGGSLFELGTYMGPNAYVRRSYIDSMARGNLFRIYVIP